MKVSIEIISDVFSLEFFINGKSASFLLYPIVSADEFELNINAKNCILTKSIYE